MEIKLKKERHVEGICRYVYTTDLSLSLPYVMAEDVIKLIANMCMKDIVKCNADAPHIRYIDYDFENERIEFEVERRYTSSKYLSLASVKPVGGECVLYASYKEQKTGTVSGRMITVRVDDKGYELLAEIEKRMK